MKQMKTRRKSSCAIAINNLLILVFLVIMGCNSKTEPAEMSAEASEIYIDNARKLIDWIVSSDSIIKWPVIYHKETNSYQVVAVADRLLSNEVKTPSSAFRCRIRDQRNLSSDSFALTPKDTALIGKARRNIKSFILKNVPAFKANLFWADTIETCRSNRNNKYLPYYSVHLPLFTEDFKIAIITINKHCPDCGHGEEIVLERIENSWKIVSREITWIN